MSRTTFWRTMRRALGGNRGRRREARTLQLEALDRREVLAAVTLGADAVLDIAGTPYRDEVDLTVHANGTLQVRHRTPNHPSSSQRGYQYAYFPLAHVQKLSFNGGADDDRFTFDKTDSRYVQLPRMELDGGAGKDLLYGGPRDDVIRGGDGNDAIYGFGGNDVIHGGSGSDTLHGDSGDYSQWGNDFLCGGPGNDSLWGENGDDKLYGGGDPFDKLDGGNGSNVIRKTACPVLSGPGDLDGDGKADRLVWRPSEGMWYVMNSHSGSISQRQWGLPNDVPVTRDYDGDGTADFAVWRPSTGTWHVLQSSNGQGVVRQLGLPGDVPVPGDYDRDGKTDFAVWRPSTGTWYVVQSSNGAQVARQWGLPGDVPVPSDFDRDGKTDFAVWRPSAGTWYVLQSSNGAQVARQWGLPGDIPTPNDFDGDGRTDFAVWRPSTGYWYVVQSGNGQTVATQWGLPGDRPATTPQATSSANQVYYRRPLLAADPAGAGGAADASPERASVGPQATDAERLAAIVDQAVATWMAAGLDPSRVELLQTVAVQFAQLDGRLLGTSDPFGVLLDADAAGHGWFVDATPSANEEFTPDPSGTLVATGNRSAAGRMDLLTVVVHELGHELGIDDLHGEDDAEQIMAHELAPGVRKGLPTCADWDAIGSVFESWSAADLHAAEFAARPSRSAVTLPDRMDRIEAILPARAARVGAPRTDFFRVLGVEEEEDSDAFEVITSPCTNPGTIAAILCARALPVLALQCTS